MIDDFLEVLREEKREVQEGGNPEDLLRDWTNAVQHLNQRAREWLQDAVSERLLTITNHAFTLEEAPFGRYQINGLLFRSPAGTVVELHPIARGIMDASGRVDLIRGASEVRILRIKTKRDHGEDAWILVFRDEDGIQRRPLDAQGFRAALKRLLLFE